MTTDIQDPFDEDLDLPEGELEYQPHRTDDPNVWGLLDVATRRWTEIPQTIYFISGDSASKPIGLLMPGGLFIPKSPTRVGNEFVYQDGGADDGQLLPKGRLIHSGHGLNAPLPTVASLEVVWDGALKSPVVEVEVDGEIFTTNEHSRGLILGNYALHNKQEFPSSTLKRLGSTVGPRGTEFSGEKAA